MQTQLAELPESRVRLEVEVDADAVNAGVRETAELMGRELKVPGFRKGKVPAEMVLQRVGRDEVLRETIERRMTGWYESALLKESVNPVGEPEIELTGLPAQSEPLRFVVEIGVLPTAEVGEWKGVEVGRAENDVPEEVMQVELDRLRQGFATLNPVDRPAARGDMLLIDYTGTIDGEEFDGGQARDDLVELGGGQLLEDFEQALLGAGAGDQREAEVVFPEDYPAEAVSGKTAMFVITLKEVREKELPELDDEFAAEASEFETLEELRESIADRYRTAQEARIAADFQKAALEAVAVGAKIELPEHLVTSQAKEMWSGMEDRLARQGIDPEKFLEIEGKTRDQIIDQARPEAERALRREATLRAVADAEGIEIAEDDLLDALQIPAGHEDHHHDEPAAALAKLRASGRDAMLIGDLRMRRALELIAEHARPIPLEQAEARETILAPEKGEGPAKKQGKAPLTPAKRKPAKKAEKLWTPGD